MTQESAPMPERDVRLALSEVLDEFDYWASEPRPAVDGGTVRIYKFREVQPAMERVLDKARALLDELSPPSSDRGA